MILLDIPQGAITIASAILVALVGGLIALAVAIFRLLYTIQGRLTALESLVPPKDAQQIRITNARMEILWEQYLYEGVRNVRRGVDPPGNPMLKERWDELLEKLEKEIITDNEAEELLSALLKRREQAKAEDDAVTMMLLGPGIVLTKWQLKEKELRESR